MKFATFIVLALAICVLLVSFAPQNSEASKKKLLKKAKKLAAIALLAKPKKLLGKRSDRDEPTFGHQPVDRTNRTNRTNRTFSLSV